MKKAELQKIIREETRKALHEIGTKLNVKSTYKILDPGTDEWTEGFRYFGRVGHGSTDGNPGSYIFMAQDSPGTVILVTVEPSDLASDVQEEL